mmetsp:Transcript_63385/g.117894  ORF Transcript_63385/g.117894 Transcript_63385/m.117894 type:complete len:226 (-) Transcript_63385:18-695(-)
MRDVTGFVIVLRKSTLSSWSYSVSPTIADEISKSKPVAASTGRSTQTVRMLKQSCTVAPANARRYSSLSPIWNIDTIVFVTDVPMFAPIIMGIAFFTSMRLLALMLIMIEVLVEDDWTNTVDKTPNTRPAIGLSNISLLRNTCPAVGPASTSNALPITPSAIMNKYRRKAISTSLTSAASTALPFSLPVFADHGLSVDSNTSTSHISRAFFAAVSCDNAICSMPA